MEQNIESLIRQQDLTTYHESAEEQMLRRGTYGEAPKLIAQFYVGAEKNHEESEKAGAPVYREKICVLVRVPGEKDCVTQEVTNEHLERYASEWQHFVKLSERGLQIPLQALPKMRPNILKAFDELGIRSVQDLVAKPVPGYLAQWKPWAERVMAVHASAEKPRMKLVDGEIQHAVSVP
jgi:hypothetical protein